MSVQKAIGSKLRVLKIMKKKFFSLFSPDACIAYLVTYIPGKMLRHYGPLSQHCLFEIGVLMAELRKALQVCQHAFLFYLPF